MHEIELAVGQSVQVGQHVLRVLAVYSDEVVLDLIEPDDAETESALPCKHAPLAIPRKG